MRETRRNAASQGAQWDTHDIKDYWFLADKPLAWPVGDGQHVIFTATNPQNSGPPELMAAWRFGSYLIWTRTLIELKQGGSWDWMSPWLSHRWPPRPEKWVEFWMEADEPNMPREVARWTVAQYQALRRTTGSTPFDNQLSAYLPDADHLITADKAFASVLERARPLLPGPLPRLHVVRGGRQGVQELCTLLPRLAS